MHISRMLEHFWKIHEDTVVKIMREAVARARLVGAEIARGRYVSQNRVGLLVPPCCALHLGSKQGHCNAESFGVGIILGVQLDAAKRIANAARVRLLDLVRSAATSGTLIGGTYYI